MVVKVVFKQPVDSCSLRMSRSILGRQIAKQQPGLSQNHVIDLSRGIIGLPGRERILEHGRLQTFRGQVAAIDLTAGGRSEPSFSSYPGFDRAHRRPATPPQAKTRTRSAWLAPDAGRTTLENAPSLPTKVEIWSADHTC